MSIKTLASRPNGITSVFNEFFEPWNDWLNETGITKAMTMPKVNITEEPDKFNLSLVAPGLHKTDFNINVEGNILTVSAEHENDKEKKNEKFHRREYNYSSFSRSFTMPADIAKDKIEATYDGGVLKLVLPKNAAAAKKTENKVVVK